MASSPDPPPSAPPEEPPPPQEEEENATQAEGEIPLLFSYVGASGNFGM